MGTEAFDLHRNFCFSLGVSQNKNQKVRSTHFLKLLDVLIILVKNNPIKKLLISYIHNKH